MRRLLLLLVVWGSIALAMEPIMTPTDIDTCSNSSELRPPAKTSLYLLAARCAQQAHFY